MTTVAIGGPGHKSVTDKGSAVHQCSPATALTWGGGAVTASNMSVLFLYLSPLLSAVICMCGAGSAAGTRLHSFHILHYTGSALQNVKMNTEM